jgi:hypothetical protein
LRFADSQWVLELGASEARYPVVARAARDVTPEGSVVLAMQHSGTLRYYAGRLTLRYDILEPGWLDRTVDWLESRGVQVFVLLDDWERPLFEERFAGQRALAGLDERVRLAYGGSSHTMLFALTAHDWQGEPVSPAEPQAPMFIAPSRDRNPELSLHGGPPAQTPHALSIASRARAEKR